MRLLAVLALLASPAMGQVNGAAILDPHPPKLLSEFGFFAGDAPAGGVVPYVISAPLFSDYAEKDRFIYSPIPAPAQVEGVLQFPVGAALIKTFRYGAHRVETRVLLHQEAGWRGFAYVWNDAGSDAVLALAGADLVVPREGAADLAYHVPNANQCKACHSGSDKAMVPIGPKLRNLNSGDQLERLAAAGVVAEAAGDIPVMPDYRDEAVDIALRARAYLDANCAHCHSPGHPADTSGLFLNWEETEPAHLGINKRPVAAGKGTGDLTFDVVPGKPEQSILLLRMMSLDPGAMMPELGRSVVHEEGVALIRDWISGLED